MRHDARAFLVYFKTEEDTVGLDFMHPSLAHPHGYFVIQASVINGKLQFHECLGWTITAFDTFTRGRYLYTTNQQRENENGDRCTALLTYSLDHLI